jgi:hypothetical protein
VDQEGGANEKDPERDQQIALKTGGSELLPAEKQHEREDGKDRKLDDEGFQNVLKFIYCICAMNRFLLTGPVPGMG